MRILLVLLAVVALAVVITPRKSVLHAQNGCDATTLNGIYGLHATGSVYDNQGYTYLLASVGKFVMDGAGNISGSDTFSLDGGINHRTFTGTYTMNADCTGSMTLQYPSGGPITTLHADFVTVSNAKQINLVETDQSFIFSGTLLQQTQTQAQTQ